MPYYVHWCMLIAKSLIRDLGSAIGPYSTNRICRKVVGFLRSMQSHFYLTPMQDIHQLNI